MTAATPSETGTRYGRPSRVPSRGLIIAGAVLGIVVATVVTVIAYQRLGKPEVSGDMVAYQVLDDDTVSVTITVTRPDPTKPVACIVRARARDGSETGRREVLVPPSQETTVVVTTTVKSSVPPYVGDIYGCGADVPAYLHAP